MNKNDFISISIRGRVAFSICCLENALKHYNYNIDEWRTLLNQLWSYTNIKFFDDWHYIIAEYLPECILEFRDFKEENFEYISEEEFKELHKLYEDTNDTIKEIIRLIFNIGIAEFYGSVENDGQRTLDNLEVLLDYMILNNMPFPDISKFKLLSFNEGDGWGIDFEGVKYSGIL